ncbi:AraD1 family protein [Altericroceibacterium spongiae]|uniref:AraD1 family protein n=1 Tax=Altericroceibacterium spongiae TaxID=2320269 RepID=UPI0011C38D8B
MKLIQFKVVEGRKVGLIDGDTARHVQGVTTILDLANLAVAEGRTLAECASDKAGDTLDLDALRQKGQLLAPIGHDDPAHCIVTGTGLTHLGSAEGRDKMHKAASAGEATDSMRMFLMGVEGGKPAEDKEGAQPEWFYKGDGSIIVGPDQPLSSPSFALDGSEEPEIAGIYLIGPDGTPHRLGYTLANEFSDHITERGNYLWLAHSKLRHAALGAELLLGDLPEDIRGSSKIIRDGKTLWEKPFLTGEANMSHSLANLEAHHFKYPLFRRPGDLHIHFFGTATLSFADGIETKEGDIFEISAPPFAIPLRNALEVEKAEKVTVKAL